MTKDKNQQKEKKIQTTVYMTEEMYRHLEQLALAYNRSFTGQVEYLLRRQLIQEKVLT